VELDDQQSRGSASETIPFPDPLSSLSPTGRRILAAARRVVGEHGFSALTFEAIAEESGENRSSIRYHFGSKAGLVQALIDSHTYEACQRLIAETESVDIPDQRIRLLVSGIRRMTQDAESFRSFFELLPHVLRSDALKDRIVNQYAWYRALNFQWLGVEQQKASRELRGLATLMVAVIDGLAIQSLLDSDNPDLEPAFELMEQFMRTTIAEVEPFSLG
jgi:AcrR family transcriptional regulator